MSKREHAFATSSTSGGPRSKRRKPLTESLMTQPAGGQDEGDVVMSGGDDGESDGINDKKVSDTVYELGTSLWQIVKDAVSKEENRPLSTAFLKKPPKRQYPDYYKIIQKPIALDDIKKRLDTRSYLTLEEVKADFELCFTNAKEYNMKDSEIWKDAKELMKVVQKTYSQLISLEEETDDAKNKTADLQKLLKTRLQKLVEKQDEHGRALSTEFMALPDKKQWAIYYKQIKNPQCLDHIFRKIKRKEYQVSSDFIADVELVFSNAMSFNQEHTIIWEDALLLRDTFRQLMSDMPAPFAVPGYTKPPNAKLKIKMPPASHATLSSSEKPGLAPLAPPNPLFLRLPVPASNIVKQSSSTPADQSISLVTTASTTSSTRPTSSPAPLVPMVAPIPTPVPRISSAISTPQPTEPLRTTASPGIGASTPAALTHVQHPYTQSVFSHYPNATYQQTKTQSITPSASPTSTLPRPSSNAPRAITAMVQPQPNHLIKSVLLRIRPRGRMITLNHKDGVRTWAIKLDNTETALQISDIVFLGEEEEESSDEEDHIEEKQEGEEEEEETQSPSPLRNGKRSRRAKGRGRPKATTRPPVAPSKAKIVKKKADKIGEIEVKSNGTVILGDNDSAMGPWSIKLGVGTNIVDVGERGGLMWRVHAERSRAN